LAVRSTRSPSAARTPRAKSRGGAGAKAASGAQQAPDELPPEVESAWRDGPIDEATLEEIRREIALDRASESELLELAAGLQQEEDEEAPDEIVASTGPVFEGEAPLASAEQRREAMEKAARRLGIPALHPEQRQVLESVLSGRDVLMVLPTGFGKSACYQIPSLIFSKPVLVISPLLALMKDQFETMQRLGLPVLKLDGQLRGRARKQALAQIAAGGRVLVMTTPESLAAPDIAEALAQGGISMAAVDEAHCISEWGYDFRPAYLQIGERLRALGEQPALALTATATEKVRLAINRFVGLRDPQVVSASPHRDNLAFDVLHCAAGARLRALVRLALRVRRPGIIYCSTTRDVDEIYAVLQRFEIPSYRYHGKMTAAERSKSQEGFMQRGRRTVMVATNAFGLGIDKADIRYVMHYQSPASLEQYVQEAGRSGRDGRRSNCILLFSSEDRSVHEALLGRSRVRPEQLYRLAKALAAWAKEEKVPSQQALALSAELGVRTTGALLALLDESGLVKWDPESVHVIVPPDEFEPRARQLAGQFETLRTQDARRLDSVANYALEENCRAVFLQDYFGEEGARACGMCDRCRGQADRPNSFWEPLAPPRGEERRTGRAVRGPRGRPVRDSARPARDSARPGRGARTARGRSASRGNGLARSRGESGRGEGRGRSSRRSRAAAGRGGRTAERSTRTAERDGRTAAGRNGRAAVARDGRAAGRAGRNGRAALRDGDERAAMPRGGRGAGHGARRADGAASGSASESRRRGRGRRRGGRAHRERASRRGDPASPPPPS